MPEAARQTFLLELHETHASINATKALARTLLWWSGLGQKVEKLLQQCTACQQTATMPPSREPLAWLATTQPWTSVHVDYAVPVEDKMILVVTDSYPGRIEAIPTTSATSIATMEIFRPIFACSWLPTCLVSDDGTPFTGTEFQDFVAKNRIRRIRTASHHPQSNELTEADVRSVKGLKKVTGGTLGTRLSRWLLLHRRKSSGVRQKSPAEIFAACRSKVKMYLVAQPEANRREMESQSLQKWSPGRPVFVKSFGKGPRWQEGVIDLGTSYGGSTDRQRNN